MINKQLIIVIALVLCILTTGCSVPQTPKESINDEQNDINDIIENDIWQLITDEHGHIVDFVMVNSYGDDGKDISVHLDSDVKYANLGDYFKSITNICKEYSREKSVSFERLSISVFQKDEPAFIFNTDLDDFYYLADYRSSDSTGYPLKTLDGLVDIFPAMKISDLSSPTIEPNPSAHTSTTVKPFEGQPSPPTEKPSAGPSAEPTLKPSTEPSTIPTTTATKTPKPVEKPKITKPSAPMTLDDSYFDSLIPIYGEEKVGEIKKAFNKYMSAVSVLAEDYVGKLEGPAEQYVKGEITYDEYMAIANQYYSEYEKAAMKEWDKFMALLS